MNFKYNTSIATRSWRPNWHTSSPRSIESTKHIEITITQYGEFLNAIIIQEMTIRTQAILISNKSSLHLYQIQIKYFVVTDDILKLSLEVLWKSQLIMAYKWVTRFSKERKTSRNLYTELMNLIQTVISLKLALADYAEVCIWQYVGNKQFSYKF